MGPDSHRTVCGDITKKTFVLSHLISNGPTIDLYLHQMRFLLFETLNLTQLQTNTIMCTTIIIISYLSVAKNTNHFTIFHHLSKVLFNGCLTSLIRPAFCRLCISCLLGAIPLQGGRERGEHVKLVSLM